MLHTVVTLPLYDLIFGPGPFPPIRRLCMLLGCYAHRCLDDVSLEERMLLLQVVMTLPLYGLTFNPKTAVRRL